MAGALPTGVSGNGRRRDPRPLLPGQRRRLDPGAGSRARDPIQGQLLWLARSEGTEAPHPAEARGRQGADAGARARVDPDVAPRAPGQGPGAHQRVREAAPGRGAAPPRERGDRDPPRSAPRRAGDRGPRPAEGLWRSAPDRRPLLQPATRWDRRCDWRQRRRKDDALPPPRR